RVDGHRDGDIAEGNPAEQNLHIFQRRDGRAALADLPFAQGVIGVVAHQGGQVKGHRQAGLPLRQQIVIAQVGLLRSGEAGELAHGPELAAVHIAMDAAGVRELSGRGVGEIAGAVHGLDGNSTDGRELAIDGFHECPARVILALLTLSSALYLRTNPTCSNLRFFASTTSAAPPMSNCWTPMLSSSAAPSEPTCGATRASGSAWGATPA